MSDAENKLKGLSKQELIDKIIADENLIGSTESQLDRYVGFLERKSIWTLRQRVETRCVSLQKQYDEDLLESIHALEALLRRDG